MNKTLIGSAAIKHWFPDFPRQPKDIDYAVNELPTEKVKGEDLLLIPIIANLDTEILDPIGLLTLKVSHLFWNIKWEKHLFDVLWLQNRGVKLNKRLFIELYEYHVQFHGQKYRSDLTQSAASFFDNALKTYDHDYLHTLINPAPIYKRVLKDGADVEPCQQKFEALSHADKLELVREEIYVMAYERLADRDYRIAYSWMLKKFIISHAPLWEALFIIENHKELYKPIYNYKQKIDHELQRNHSEV